MNVQAPFAVVLGLALCTGGCSAVVRDFNASLDGSAGGNVPPDGGEDGGRQEGGATTEDASKPWDGGTDAPAGVAHLTVTSSTLDFGTVTTNQATLPRTINVTNTGDAASAVLTTAITGAEFSIIANSCAQMTLAPSAACHVEIALSDSAAGSPQGVFTVTDTPTDTITVNVSADVVTPGALSVSPQSWNFQSWAVGANSPANLFTITNAGMSVSGVLSVALDPTNGTTAAELPITDGCSGKTLQPNGTCTVSVLLAPASGGPKSGTLAVSATPGGTATASLTGAGLTAASLTIAPTSYSFPTSPAGQAGPSETFTVTNVGGSTSESLTAALGVGPGTGASEFLVTHDGCTGTTLTGGGTCNVAVQFDPETFGSKSATLSINGGLRRRQ